MTIRHLKVFITVAELGKMSLAAERLYISQPAISQAIHELEVHYKVLLFERMSKKLYITAAGELLLCKARQVVASFEELEENMMDSKRTEVLRIGATVTIGDCMMINFVNAFQESFHQVVTEVFVNNTKLMEEKLLKSELDIALIEGKIKSTDLIVEPVMEDSLVLICGREHAFYGQEQITIESLAKERFVLREEGSGTRELFETYMIEQGQKISVSWTCNAPETIKKAVMDVQGISVLSIRLVKQEIKEGNLYAFMAPNGEWKRTFSLVYHKNKHRGKYFQYFMELVKKSYQEKLFEGIKTGILISNMV